MAGATVSVSTGAMNSVIGKLTALLGDEYNHLKSVKKGIIWLRAELSSMNAVLLKLADMEDDQIDVQMKEWRNKVRELSYDTEDCIDRFMHRVSLGEAKANFIRKKVRKMKLLWEDHKIGNEIKELKARVADEKERSDRYDIHHLITMPRHVLLDPRAPVLYEEVKNLVGIDQPREKILGWIKDEEKQLKVVSIFGTGGVGKTTLAMEVYNKTEESFDCRAMVSVSRTPDIKKLLRDILFQINRREYDESKEWAIEQLIPMLKKNLKDKRYFVVIDDIWSTEAWEHLKCALPDNDNRSRIIVTTRNKDVARSCCTGRIGHTYEVKHLSEEDSSNLFFRRVFSNEDCPTELIAVANEILRKCGGLPLAIISIAGLLANKNRTVEEWIKAQKFISSAVDRESSIGKMNKILSLSYFDLPQYLKSCLLYLSIYPEDYSIDTTYLIREWIAGGLITGKNQESMEQEAESYLNELINRSMIQATKVGVDGTRVKFCKVHDVILDFIVSRALEENFVTVLSGNYSCGYSSNKIRRLSLNSKCFEDTEMSKAMNDNDISHLRSFHMFIQEDEVMQEYPQLSSCQVLRVLHIEDNRKMNNKHIGFIGRLCQLKYLRITRSHVSELPEEIGKLHLLETLDLQTNYEITKLPASIVQLQKLVHLFIHYEVPLPDGIGSLQALEELSEVNLSISSVKSIQGLGELTKLRALKIRGVPAGSKDRLEWEGRIKVYFSSLSKLTARSLQSLNSRRMNGSDYADQWIISCDSYSPLRRLILQNETPTILSQVCSLVNLTRLYVYVAEVGEEGVKILASLPRLLSLTVLLSPDVPNGRLVISSQGFERLVKFNFQNRDGWGLMFEQGVMPKLQRLKLRSSAAMGEPDHRGLILGLPHLSCLKSITVEIYRERCTDDKFESMEKDIRDAAVVHPNNPILEIKRSF